MNETENIYENEIKNEDEYETFNKDKEMFDFSKYSDSNKSVVGIMKDEAGLVTIEKCVGLKPKMHSFLVDDSSEHKKRKECGKNGVLTINHGEYKNVMLNKKCLRHSMNRI